MIRDLPGAPNTDGRAATASDLLGLFTAHWKSAILATAVELDLFGHLNGGLTRISELGEATGIPSRGVQALLDGLVSVGVVELGAPGEYRNAEVATKHLVRGLPTYIGGFARIVIGSGDGGMRQWSKLPDALRLGRPVEPETILEPDSPFWPELVMALLPLSCEVASIAADLVGLRDMTTASILDIGGGGGAYALTWLPLNPNVRLTQIDWAPVNALAERVAQSRQVDDRFETVDGDFNRVELGRGRYDVVVLSNICHHLDSGEIGALFSRIAEALVPGGRIVLSDFVLNDDRTGPQFAACFGVGMILQTKTGSSYRGAEYATWLSEAGFVDVQIHRSHPISTLVIARTGTVGEPR